MDFDQGLQITNLFTDVWYNPETDGQGFFIHVFTIQRLVSLAWFTYDTYLPENNAKVGHSGQRWLTALGPIDGNQATLTVEMASGGLFDTPTKIKRKTDGTIILTFDGINSGIVEYDIRSINRQGIIPIQRVVNDNLLLYEYVNGGGF